VEGSTTNAVDPMMNLESQRFLIGCTIGDGCLSKDKRHGSVTLHIQRKQAHLEYAKWQLQKLNLLLNTNASLKHFLDKGKYPAIRFGVTNKKLLTPVYDLLYPQGKKLLTPKVLEGLGLQELALFWMDDGSLEVRKRKRPTGTIKIERSAWLAVCENEETVSNVGNWIQDLTTARYTTVRHVSGNYYLRWHSLQCKTLIEKLHPFVLPCLRYKVDLSRTGTVSEWLSESKLPSREMDDKATRVPRTQPNKTVEG